MRESEPSTSQHHTGGWRLGNPAVHKALCKGRGGGHSVPLTPQLLPLLGAIPTGNRVTLAGQKRGQAHSPARRRAAAGVGLRGRSDGRLGDWTGCERRSGDPVAAASGGGQERTEPAGGSADFWTGKAQGAATSTRLFACHLHGAPGMDLPPSRHAHWSRPSPP